MWQALRGLGAAAALSVALCLGAPIAGAADLHAFWDQRCNECHGHAGAFARQYLGARDGQLIGRRRTDNLLTFLGQHYMGPSEAQRIYAMLLAQVTTKPVYQQNCAGCHGTAAELVRLSIDRVEGQLVGRAKGRPLATFLQRHGGLEAGELDTVLSSLGRVLDEVRGGAPQ